MLPFRLDRRATLAASLFAGMAVPAAASGRSPLAPQAAASLVPATAFGVDPARPGDQSAALQSAIDHAAARGLGLQLPPGRLVVGGLLARPGMRLVGATASSTLVFNGRGFLLGGKGAADIELERLTLDGAGLPLDSRNGGGLVWFEGCYRLSLAGVSLARSAGHGLLLTGCSGRIVGCAVEDVRGTAIFSRDATGLEIAHNSVAKCGDNGILVWRAHAGEDGTRVVSNTISRITARSGGSGQNGNGINVFRAGGVQVNANSISDCAYSAVRANEASNVQIVGNQAQRSGEVALYVEAAGEKIGSPGFEAAIISSNLVDHAASGIVVTNFDKGGRLAVVSGNLVRNLFRRESEPRDKRGDGIMVEADAIVSDNIVEGAPTAGIQVGWGAAVRDVVVTGNLVRRSRIGIAVSSTAGAGVCLIANNMISGAIERAICAMAWSEPRGEDLARGAAAPANITLAANVATG